MTEFKKKIFRCIAGRNGFALGPVHTNAPSLQRYLVPKYNLGTRSRICHAGLLVLTGPKRHPGWQRRSAAPTHAINPISENDDSSHPGNQKLTLEDQFLGQVGIELEEQFVLQQYFALPFLDIDREGFGQLLVGAIRESLRIEVAAARASSRPAFRRPGRGRGSGRRSI